MNPVFLIDSREQRPLVFSDGIQTERTGLVIGDYSVKGHEDHGIILERKSLSDLCGSLCGERRERLLKELRAMRGYRFKAIIVEGSWPGIISGLETRGMNPNSILGALMSFAVKFGVVPVLADDHATASELTERILLNYCRMIERDFMALGAVAAAAESAEPAGAVQ